MNLVFELKFLDVFMGREDPIEFYIEFYIVLVFYWFIMIYCFVGMMGGINLTPLCFFRPILLKDINYVF